MPTYNTIASEIEDRYRESETEYRTCEMNETGSRNGIDLGDDIGNDAENTTCSWEYIYDEVW